MPAATSSTPRVTRCPVSRPPVCAPGHRVLRRSRCAGRPSRCCTQPLRVVRRRRSGPGCGSHSSTAPRPLCGGRAPARPSQHTTDVRRSRSAEARHRRAGAPLVAPPRRPDRHRATAGAVTCGCGRSAPLPTSAGRLVGEVMLVLTAATAGGLSIGLLALAGGAISPGSACTTCSGTAGSCSAGSSRCAYSSPCSVTTDESVRHLVTLCRRHQVSRCAPQRRLDSPFSVAGQWRRTGRRGARCRSTWCGRH